MKKFRRAAAIVLVVICLVSMLSTVALAATSKSGTNLTCTVVTSKRPWYSFLNPTIKIKNTGTTPMNIFICDSNGRTVSNLIGLKAGKTHTFTLKCDQTYTVYWMGNAWGGSMNAKGTISAGRYITDIR